MAHYRSVNLSTVRGEKPKKILVCGLHEPKCWRRKLFKHPQWLTNILPHKVVVDLADLECQTLQADCECLEVLKQDVEGVVKIFTCFDAIYRGGGEKLGEKKHTGITPQKCIDVILMRFH